MIYQQSTLCELGEDEFESAAEDGTSPNHCFEAALRLLRLGFTPIPIRRNDKRPLINWQEFQNRKPTDEELRSWWAKWPDANLAIVTGEASGVDVIDTDIGHDDNWPPAGCELPGACVVRTPSGGFHNYVTHIPGVKNSTSKLAEHVDVRGDGGYVLVPPSATAVGAHELVQGGFETARECEAPDWLREALLDTANAGRATAGKTPEATPAGPVIRRGHRHTELCRLAGTMRRRGMGEPEILAALRETNRTRCELPLDDEEVARIARDIGRKDPGAPPPYPDTDAGNAECFADLNRERLRFDHRRGDWLVWRGHWWDKDVDGEVVRLAKECVRRRLEDATRIEDDRDREHAVSWAMKSESRSRLEALLSLARNEHPLADAGDKWDANPMLIGVENGVVDLRTGELRAGRQEDRITRHMPVAYDSKATCPLWKKFLGRVMNGDPVMVRHLQRLAGMWLTGDISEQILVILFGEGNNGKNVFVDTMMGLMGDYATTAPPGLLTVQKHEQHPTEIADLMGRRLVVASETEEGARLRLQLVKRLTGDQRLKGRFMRQDFFEFRRTHKLVLVTNNRPVIRESTVAAWRRVHLIPFEVVIPAAERDEHLTDKLEAEWPGILNWAIAGCLEWQKHGLQTPKKVLAATEEYKQEQDVLADFIDAECIEGVEYTVPRVVLWARYKEWTKDNERYPLGRKMFYEQMRKRYGRETPRPACEFRGITIRSRAGCGDPLPGPS